MSAESQQSSAPTSASLLEPTFQTNQQQRVGPMAFVEAMEEASLPSSSSLYAGPGSEGPVQAESSHLGTAFGSPSISATFRVGKYKGKKQSRLLYTPRVFGNVVPSFKIDEIDAGISAVTDYRPEVWGPESHYNYRGNRCEYPSRRNGSTS